MISYFQQLLESIAPSTLLDAEDQSNHRESMLPPETDKYIQFPVSMLRNNMN